MRISHGLFAACALGTSTTANAQTTCGDGVSQLQAYISQVNQIAYYEYSQGIGMRCMGNMQCGYYLLAQLNQWYNYQASLANTWYMQLARQCSSQSPTRLNRGSVDSGIDEEAVEEMEVDDEDKTVVLRIPDNPRGFRPRQ